MSDSFEAILKSKNLVCSCWCRETIWSYYYWSIWIGW